MDRNFGKEGGPEKHDSTERIDSIWKIWEIFKGQNARTVFLHILPELDCQQNNLENKFI